MYAGGSVPALARYGEAHASNSGPSESIAAATATAPYCVFRAPAIAPRPGPGGPPSGDGFTMARLASGSSRCSRAPDADANQLRTD